MGSKTKSFAIFVSELKSRVDPSTLEKYRINTCVDGDLEYKLHQLFCAASHDVPEDQIVNRALFVIDQCLLLRDALEIDKILDDDYFPKHLVPCLQSSSCMSVVGEDVSGNTVIYFNLTKFDPVEYTRVWEMGRREIPHQLKINPEFNDHCVVNYCSMWYVRMMEWIHKHRFGGYRKGKSKEPKVVMILDIESAGISTYSTELKLFLKGIKVSGGYLFPEICDYIYAANVPWLAYSLWPVIRLFLHPATASKVDLYDKKRTNKTLTNMIKPSELPPSFGGDYEPETKFESCPARVTTAE